MAMKMRRLLLIAIAIGAFLTLGNDDDSQGPPKLQAVEAEKYRLVHAIENTERIVAKGLSKRECESRKREHIAVAEALGVHSERLGIGSITCLPESFFEGE